MVGLAAVLAGVAGSSAAGASPRAEPATTLTAALRSDLDQYLAAHGATDHISAASLRVTYPDARPALAVSAGTTTYGGSTPVSDGALWQIGSNTKAFTSVVALQLEAERKLSMRDRLGKWLPQYPAWRDVTIQQLLSMTSGIPDYLNTADFVEAYQADPGLDPTPATMIGWVAGQPLGPSTYSYSNTNYLLVQLIIERASHDSYFDQVTRRIIAPLGLHDTCFGPETCPARFASRMPTGYSMASGLPEVLGQAVPPLALGWAQAAGGLISSLKDMTTWDRALYTGRELPAAQQRELESLISVTTSKPIKVVTAADPLAFGLGVAQKTDPVTGVTWAYQGEGTGYRVVHLYSPANRMIVAVALNSGVDVSTLPDLADTLYRTLTRR
jgi:D-alanyl-D-alanine carboxypeptidase